MTSSSDADEVAVESIGNRQEALGLPEPSDGATPTSPGEPAAPSNDAYGDGWLPPAGADYYALEQPTRPTAIRIPAIDVETVVRPVGLDESNAVAVPDDITKVGWYKYGVAPGSRQGSAVLVAHRDGAVQGRGVFYDLGALELGDKVVITEASGEKVTYKVVARELLDKSAFGKNAADLFSIYGRPRLTLISCGGYYDRNNGGYQANIIVTAVPTTEA